MNSEKHSPVDEEVVDGESTGIEKELQDPKAEILKPFDPEKIKVQRETKTVSLVFARIGHGEIDLAPEFQRRARIWDDGRKSRLIESLLLRIPLPVFYVAADQNENWTVVDGLQRLTTIYDFMTNEFPLLGLEYLVQFEKRDFDSLTRDMQRRIEETELVINVIQPGTPEEVMFNIFSRINTGGLILNGQEIRHAMNKGPARNFLAELVEAKSFQVATSASISDKRMGARECALRFLAFLMTPWEDYETSDLDGFLNAAMRKLNEVGDKERKLRQEEFERALNAAYQLFGDDAFRKRYEIGVARNPISKALFECWTVNLARSNDRVLSALQKRSPRLQEEFIQLMNNDREFDVSISYSTGSPQRVQKRFETIKNLITEVSR